MEDDNEASIFCGTCPDSHCGNVLYFISKQSVGVDCTKCGQRHATGALLNIKETNSSSAAVGNLLKSMLLNNSRTRKGTELVKVRGLSNYHCKLVSPLLTYYGMDKNSGKAKLLSELKQPDVFDCSLLGNRAFLIEKEHLEIDGYGKDKTGSLSYLKDTLELINQANGGETLLVPLHADGDGHCLVHAISKAVVGRELLWHSLRQNLRDHLEKENVQYQALFHDFIDQDEWNDIIAEADPDFYPETNEPFGLRNIHVFGLANVLHRPIILLDSTEGMQSSGDYSGIFLPVLCPVDKCKSQGVINKPLAIAWSSSARNHYVPLVGIKELSLPKIPRILLPKAWGVPNQLVSTYIDFDEHGCSMIGGSRSLPESYVERLVAAMDEVFYEKYQISPQLVADVNQFICKPSNAVGVSLVQVTEFAHQAVESGTLYRCLSCQAVKETKEQVPQSWGVPGGKFYKMVEETSTGLVSDAIYTFPEAEYEAFMYNAKEDMLKSIFAQRLVCPLCKGVLRQVYADGTVRYVNGDPTLTTTNTTRGCSCGFKHYWDGKEYDNLPKSFSVPLEWNGKKVEEEICWFEMESDPSLNSNAYEIALALVQKHFPGKFGSEVLVRKVVDKILQETAVKGSDKALPHVIGTKDDEEMTIGHNEAPPSKIILIGPKKKTLHKEELTKSECEKLTRARTTHHAAYSQNRKSARESSEKAAGSSKLGKQEVPKGKEKAKPASVPKVNVPGNSEPRTVAGDPSKPRDRKIRLSSTDGKQATVTLSATATYGDLQEAVFAQLGIAKDRQKFRYGFPPRELLPPDDGNDVLPLTHGDRVSVEELPEKMDHQEQDIPPENTPPSGIMETAEESWSDDEFEGLNREQFASELMNLFRGALNVDRWETMQHQPELFSHGGYVYDKVLKELGSLRDDQHCSITELPGKTFAYNAKEDRLEICLGKVHIPVQPLDPATLARAHARSGTTPSLGLFQASTLQDDEPPQRLGAFSGALHHRDAAKGRSAFSGMGRTLGGSEKAEEEKKYSDGVIQMDVVSTQDIATHDKDAGETTMASGNDNASIQDTMSELVKEGEEAMTVDTEETKQIASTDVEMKSSDAQESETIVDSVLPVVREVTALEQKRMNVDQEGTTIEQEESSVTHEKLSVLPEETSAPEEMGGAGEAMSGGPEDMNGVPVKMSGAPKAMSSASDEMVVPPKETSSAPKAMSGAPEKTSSAPEEIVVPTENTSSAPKAMSVAPKDTSSASEEMVIPPEETSGAPEEMSGAPEEIPVELGGASKETSGAPEEMSGAPEEILVEMGGASKETSGTPEQTSGAPEATGGAPEEGSAMPKVTSGAQEMSSNVYGTSSTPHESSSVAQEAQNTDHEFSSVKHEALTNINKISDVTHEQPNTPQVFSSHVTSEGSRNSEPIVREGLVAVADEENPPMDTASADEREDIDQLGIVRNTSGDEKQGVGGDTSKDDDQMKGTSGDTSADADQIKGTPGDT